MKHCLSSIFDSNKEIPNLAFTCVIQHSFDLFKDMSVDRKCWSQQIEIQLKNILSAPDKFVIKDTRHIRCWNPKQYYIAAGTQQAGQHLWRGWKDDASGLKKFENKLVLNCKEGLGGMV